MRKTYSNRSWERHPRHFLRPFRELILEVIKDAIEESPECFTVLPRCKLNRFRDSISPTRLSTKGWYKRYKKLAAL